MEWRKQINQERISVLLGDDFDFNKRSNSHYIGGDLRSRAASNKNFLQRKGSHDDFNKEN